MMQNNETKPVIKIFVSHRIDQVSETIDNPLYVNVRCGAVYDKRNPEEYGHILGDDTGDNISKKRSSFCELTVLYWAWKNTKADYYGLCHYRRFLSFGQTHQKANPMGCIIEKTLSRSVVHKHRLDDQDFMENQVKQYDIITCEPVDLRKINYKYHSLYRQCEMLPNDINIKDVDLLLDVIKEKSPQYYSYAIDYYNKPITRWYNCFIMKKNYLDDLCSWAFDILFEVEKKIDSTNYSRQKSRTLGFFFEHLYGIYLDYLQATTNVKIKELPLIFIEDAKKEVDLQPAFEEDNIPIVVLSSDYYVPYLSVYLRALAAASKSSNYDVIVLTKSITEDNKKKLKKSVRRYSNLSLRFYNPKNIIGDIKFYVSSTSYAEEANYRLLVPWILSSYNKAIVTDVDLIFREDPAVLYKSVTFEPNECIAFAKDVVFQGWILMDPEMMEYTVNALKMKKPFNYVNTGVMVADLDRIRKLFSANYILDFAMLHHFKIQEQDILNVLYEGKIHFLDIAWNFYLPTNAFVEKCLLYAPAHALDEYEEAGKKPFVMHWASQPKPWINPSIVDAEFWWTYAKADSFYERILFNMIITVNKGAMYRGGNFHSHAA